MRFMYLILALICLSCAVQAADTVLVSNGQAKAVIVAAAGSEVAQEAAVELQDYVFRMSGAKLPIVASASSSAVNIYVGRLAAAKPAVAMKLKMPTGLTYQFNEEGYVIAADSKSVILAGNETEPYLGTYFAVSDFLYDLGCRWYMPGKFGEVVPRLKTIAVKQGSRVSRPDFRVRDVWYSGHLPVTTEQSNDFVAWKRHNRLVRSDMWTGCLSPLAKYLQNPQDDSTKRLLPVEKYFDSHPEYYSLNPDGTRNPDFLCVSNPEAIKAAADTVIQYFRDNPTFYSFGFSPPDAPVLCSCEQCKKAMHNGFSGEGFGDVSDPYFVMVFRIADEVRKEFPNRWIISMAYYNRCRPPEGVQGKHPNVLIQYAYIQQCSLHSYEDKNCLTRVQFGDMLKRWSELVAGLIAYDYDPHDWMHSQRPAWRSKALATDMRFAAKLGSWGYSDEGMMAWMVTGLNYYVRSRVAWDLSENTDALLDDFFQKFFGPASKPMKSFYTGVENALLKSKSHYMNPFSSEGPNHDDFINAVTPRVIRRSSQELVNAENLAQHEPYKSRVAAFKSYFLRVESILDSREAMSKGNYPRAIRSAQGMLDAVTRVDNSMLLQDAGPWGGSQSGVTTLNRVKEVAAYTDGSKGKLVAVLNNDATYRTDPFSQGVTGRWCANSGSGWKDIKLSAAWYHQGVVTSAQTPFKGVVWYKTAVDVPEKLTSARIFIPELKGSEVYVWVNGMFADNAMHSSNISLDVSDLLKRGKNEICFRVIGFGGFTTVPFVYVPVK